MNEAAIKKLAEAWKQQSEQERIAIRTAILSATKGEAPESSWAFMMTPEVGYLALLGIYCLDNNKV